MKILILAGTGAMGVHLAKILAAENDVYITSRQKHNNENHIYYLQGDAHDSGFLEEVLKSRHWDALVDFLVYTSGSLEVGLTNCWNPLTSICF